MEPKVQNERPAVLLSDQLQTLFEHLQKRGYLLAGPTVQDGAIIYQEFNSATELPRGWTDEQSNGHYRIENTDGSAFFSYVVGAQSWKRFLFPATLTIWKIERQDGEARVVDESQEVPKYAFIGVRPCELQAIAIQARVLTGGEFIDPIYKARRGQLFILVVNCVVTGGTCFCASMKTGPKATSGFDLALTEVVEANQHYFVVDVGSALGAEILKELDLKKATAEQLQTASELQSKAAKVMGRHLDTEGLSELLHRSDEHPRWEDAAGRCLTCGNCTSVCPTCFCVNFQDRTDLSGRTAERVRKWDSCFTVAFSYIHGGSVRTSAKARYRQWMTHKLASWVDQFGSFGCVGCGRCITWCPVGIDITAEALAIQESSKIDDEKRQIKEHVDGNA